MMKAPGNRKAVNWDGEDLVWAGDGRTFLRGVGEYFLKHPFFEEAFERILNEYRPKKRYKLGLFLPCAYGKPYSQSYIHYQILRSLRGLGRDLDEVHQMIVTNAGVVPRELEEHYPFCCYDWNPAFEDDEVKRRYSEVLFERLKRYIRTFRNFYDKFCCYLRPDSDSYKSIRLVERSLRMRIPNLALAGNVPIEEVEDVSLGIYGYEKDLILITPTNLRNFAQKVKEALR